MSGPISHQPWWRRLKFHLSLRGSMVLVLILGGWLGWIVYRARVQREVVRTVREAGGSVEYDDQRVYPHSMQPRKIWAPQWLVDSLGIDYFRAVNVVRFRESGANEMAASITRLGKIDAVIFNSSDLSDAGLAHLGAMDVHYIYVEKTKVTDAGLEKIRGMAELEDLDLFGTSVTDSGVAWLKSLANLKTLNLNRARVSRSAIQALQASLPDARIYPE